MNYKLLALDLDETLLNENYRVSQRNREAVQKAVQKGIMVTIATGRIFRSALPYARELQVDLPLVTYHGALIKKVSGEVLMHRSIPGELTLDILNMAEEEGFYINLFLDDRLYIKEENESARYYKSIASIPAEVVGSLPSFFLREKKEPTKMSIISKDEDYLDELRNLLLHSYAPELSVMQSRPFFLEIIHSGASKGQALSYLAQMDNIRPEEIVAIGDSYNDIDMLQFAGLGVAMANAPEEVKRSADVIAGTNTEDGVALFMEEYLLK